MSAGRNRLVIYPKDIQQVLGKSERYGRYLLDRIREANRKEKHQYVTIREFCIYTGIPEAEVLFLLYG